MMNPPSDVIAVLHRAADLVLVYGPNPVGCIRAAVYGRPDVVLPHWDTTESLLVEDAEYRLQREVNPLSVDADEDDGVDEWAADKTPADVRGAFINAATELEAGV